MLVNPEQAEVHILEDEAASRAYISQLWAEAMALYRAGRWKLTFSPELVDATIFVIDVAEGDKIPRKGGPGIIRSDLLVINKTDLAPYVGTSLEVMEQDSRKMRGERPFLFTNIRSGEHVDEVAAWIRKNVLLEE